MSTQLPTCKHAHCRRKVRAPGRKECHRCNKRAWRLRNPFKAAYSMCKANARKRKSAQWPNGIPWEITFAAFTIWARRTQYLTRKGNETGSITIDRKDYQKGYVPGNLRAVTRKENCEKQAREQKHRMEEGYSWRARY